MKRYILAIFCLSILICSCNSGQHAKETRRSFAADKILKQGASYGFGDHVTNASLDIKSVLDTGFNFTIEAVSGGNDDQLEGFAVFVNDSEAVYKEDNETVAFTIKANSVFVSEKGSGGIVGINFDGEYNKDFSIPDSSGDIGFLDQNAASDLKAKAGAHYSELADCMDRYSEDDSAVKEDTVAYKVYSGGINGLFTIDEAKILTRGHFYYAGLVFDDTVHLYTNDPVYLADKKKLPSVIDKWIPDMSHSQVILHY